jgi:hypothetical protein
MRYVGVAAIAAPLAIGRLLAQLPAMHAEDNGLAVDFTVTTPGQTPDPVISAPLRPRGVAPQRRGAGSDRRPGAASRGSTGRPQEGRREAPQLRRDLSGTLNTGQAQTRYRPRICPPRPVQRTGDRAPRSAWPQGAARPERAVFRAAQSVAQSADLAVKISP